jgi:tetratricopeptide (TPR) repeat protein
MDIVLGILGDTVLRVGQSLDTEWGRPKERAVLAALATQPGKSMSVDALRDWVWDGDDELNSPTSALQTHVSRLRNPLNQVYRSRLTIVREYRGYRLDVDRSVIDYFAFGDAMAHARRVGAAGDHAQACGIARQALALWRGTPLAELDSDRACNWRRSVIENEWIPANIALVTSLVDVGDPAEALRLLNALDRDHGDNLLVAEQRLRALYAQWRVDEAKAYYYRFRKRMRDSLDDESAAEIHRFHEQLVASRGVSAARRVRPDQLPDPVPDFVGRRDLLATLDAAVAASAKVIVLCGPGGVGKTALAVQWARRRRAADGALYVDLNGFGRGPKVGEVEVVDSCLAALGVVVPEVSGDQASVERLRRAKLRELMLDRRMVVLLDNVVDAAQVQRLAPLFGVSIVLVTSRKRLLGLAVSDGARMVNVPPLAHDDGVALLASRMGRPAADSAAVSQLAELCEGFPLALTLVGDRVATRPGAPLSAFVDQLRGSRLLKLGGRGDVSGLSLKAAFELSYLALSDSGRRLFRVLGLHPGLDVGVEAVTAIAGCDVEDALEELVDAHLLDQRGDLDRYQLHDLLHVYAAELAGDEEHAAEREAAELRLQSFYFHSANNAHRRVFSYDSNVPPLDIAEGVVPVEFADRVTATRWFDVERSNLVAVMAAALDGGRREYWRTPQVVAPPFIRFGWLADAKRAWEIALDLADEDDAFAQGASVNNLGCFLLHVGEYDEAQPLLESALRYATEDGSDLGIATVSLNLGRIEVSRGRFPRALELFDRALRFAQRTDSVALQASTMHRIGTTYRAAGEPGVAAKWLYQALAMRESAKDAHGTGDTLSELGSLLAERGDKVNAIAHGEQAVALLEEIHDLAGARNARIRLAQTHIALDGDRDAALAHALRAVELARSTWHSETEATALDAVGQIRYAMADVAGAAQAWRAAARIYLDRGDARGRQLTQRLDDLGAA